MAPWTDIAIELRKRLNKTGRPQGRSRQRQDQRQNVQEGDGRGFPEDTDGLIRRNQRDNAFYKLHYQVTSLVLAFSCILVSSNIFIGNAITCTGQPSNFKLSKEDIDSYCIPNGKGLLPKRNGNGYDLDSSTATWYQWSSLLLLLQSACFYLPNIAWKNFDRSLVNSVVAHMSSTDLSDDSSMFTSRAVMWFSKSKRLHHKYFVMKHVCDLLYLINSLVQCFILNYLLSGLWSRFLSSPMETFTKWQNDEDKQYQSVFPKKIECNFRFYGPSGTIMEPPILCTAQINHLNDRIYFCLMIWFTIVLSLTVLVLIIKLFLLYPASMKQALITKFGKHGQEKAEKLYRNYDMSCLYVLLAILTRMSQCKAEEFLDELCRREAGSNPSQTISIPGTH